MKSFIEAGNGPNGANFTVDRSRLHGQPGFELQQAIRIIQSTPSNPRRRISRRTALGLGAASLVAGATVLEVETSAISAAVDTIKAGIMKSYHKGVEPVIAETFNELHTRPLDFHSIDYDTKQKRYVLAENPKTVEIAIEPTRDRNGRIEPIEVFSELSNDEKKKVAEQVRNVHCGQRVLGPVFAGANGDVTFKHAENQPAVDYGVWIRLVDATGMPVDQNGNPTMNDVFIRGNVVTVINAEKQLTVTPIQVNPAVPTITPINTPNIFK